MRLDTFDNQSFERGRSRLVESLWFLVSWLFVSSWIPGSSVRVFWLRLFGARIGSRARLKPRIRVKFPWRLELGDHVWIGEGVWIDNLDWTRIGSHCCVSQGAYLCTGSHDWSRDDFALITAPITLEDHCWLGARSTVAPGVRAGTGAVLALAAVATGDLEPWAVYAGNPATRSRSRVMGPAAETQTG